MDVILVRGGIARLRSAWALMKREHRVKLLEQGTIPTNADASAITTA